MKKTLSIIALLMLGACFKTLVAQEKHTLTFEGGNTSLRTSLALKSSYADGQSINAEMVLLYDMASRDLTVQIIPKKGSYDRVFIPMKTYEMLDLKEVVRTGLNGKAKFERAFKSGMPFEVGPAVTVSGASVAEEVKTDIKSDMRAVDDALVLHYRVDSPDRPVILKLRGFTAVSMLETASGKNKYIFDYMADDSQFEIIVPVDPCKTEKIISIQSSTKALYDEALASHTELSKAAGMKEKEKCQACKEMFDNDYRNRLKELKSEYRQAGVTCSIVDRYIKEIEIAIHDADTISCPRSGERRAESRERRAERGERKVEKGEQKTETPTNVAKIINDDVKKLDRLVDRIGAGKDVANAKREGLVIISQVEERIKLLDDKTKNKADVRSAIKSFGSTRKAFEAVIK